MFYSIIRSKAKNRKILEFCKFDKLEQVHSYLYQLANRYDDNSVQVYPNLEEVISTYGEDRGNWLGGMSSAVDLDVWPLWEYTKNGVSSFENAPSLTDRLGRFCEVFDGDEHVTWGVCNELNLNEIWKIVLGNYGYDSIAKTVFDVVKECNPLADDECFEEVEVDYDFITNKSTSKVTDWFVVTITLEYENHEKKIEVPQIITDAVVRDLFSRMSAYGYAQVSN